MWIKILFFCILGWLINCSYAFKCTEIYDDNIYLFIGCSDDSCCTEIRSKYALNTYTCYSNGLCETEPVIKDRYFYWVLIGSLIFYFLLNLEIFQIYQLLWHQQFYFPLFHCCLIYLFIYLLLLFLLCKTKNNIGFVISASVYVLTKESIPLSTMIKIKVLHI
jgi:hypothetical protein